MEKVKKKLAKSIMHDIVSLIFIAVGATMAGAAL